MKKRYTDLSIPQIIRHLIQVAAFLAVPGMFILTFTAVGSLVSSVIQGTFSAASMTSDLLLIAAVFGVTILCGRFFCGFLCAFGSVQEFLYGFPRLFIRKRTQLMPEGIDELLKYLKFFVLAAIVFFCWFLRLSPDPSMNPWSVFGIFTNLNGWSSLSPWFTAGGILLIAILAGSCFVERFFCRYLCPLGALFALVSHLRLFRIRKKDHECSSCGFCNRYCSMGIDLAFDDSVTSAECIHCFKCLDHCPAHALKTDANPAVSGILAITMILGINALGSAALQAAPENAPAVTAEEPVVPDTADDPTETWGDNDQADIWNDDSQADDESGDGQADSWGGDSQTDSGALPEGTYKDGTYTGTGSGYRGTTEVQVTVQGGRITDIQLLSTGDDMQWFERAWQSIVSAILDSQQTEVDSVSGATFSSNGIKEAVCDALGIEYENNNDSLGDVHGHHHGY